NRWRALVNEEGHDEEVARRNRNPLREVPAVATKKVNPECLTGRAELKYYDFALLAGVAAGISLHESEQVHVVGGIDGQSLSQIPASQKITIRVFPLQIAVSV